jgi:EAL domain-containing protein (putative c-di-GMP-specific phosphodiesterase class I)
MIDDGVLIAPDVFLHVAERMDLIDRIDRWVVREAIRLLANEQHGGHELRLHVNLSAVSLADEELPAYIARELENATADGRGLCFEITETAAIINMERARRFAARVAKLGCKFALDDFGTGFASFYYLKHLPFDHLKIGGEFIQDLANSPTDQLVVKSIAEIAHGLEKGTIAEFVSDRQGLELLERYGVDYAQGFYISRPTPISDTHLARHPAIQEQEQKAPADGVEECIHPEDDEV